MGKLLEIVKRDTLVLLMNSFQKRERLKSQQAFILIVTYYFQVLLVAVYKHRCIQTANIIYPDKTPIIIDELRETDFGSFEGKNYKELSDNADYIKWIASGGTLAFPGGESMSDATNRTMIGFQKLIAESKDYKAIVAVVHGGTIMSIIKLLLQLFMVEQ